MKKLAIIILSILLTSCVSKQNIRIEGFDSYSGKKLPLNYKQKYVSVLKEYHSNSSYYMYLMELYPEGFEKQTKECEQYRDCTVYLKRDSVLNINYTSYNQKRLYYNGKRWRRYGNVGSGTPAYETEALYKAKRAFAGSKSYRVNVNR